MENVYLRTFHNYYFHNEHNLSADILGYSLDSWPASPPPPITFFKHMLDGNQFARSVRSHLIPSGCERTRVPCPCRPPPREELGHTSPPQKKIKKSSSDVFSCALGCAFQHCVIYRPNDVKKTTTKKKSNNNTENKLLEGPIEICCILHQTPEFTYWPPDINRLRCCGGHLDTSAIIKPVWVHCR